MIRSNMHTHTTFSDGNHTAQENIRSALEKGFTALGFSDHVYSRAGEDYCMKPDLEPVYRRHVRRLKEEYRGRLEILLGIESEPFIPVEREEYDYVIGSVHHLLSDGFYHPIDHSLTQQQTCIREAFGGKPVEMFKAYFDVLVEATLRNRPDIVGHFDVITKFGLVDENDPGYRDAALQAMDAVLSTGAVVEINTGAMSKGLRTVPYPSEFLLMRILEKGGRVMLNSDSHFSSNLDYAFEQVGVRLKTLGFSSVWELSGTGFVETVI